MAMKYSKVLQYMQDNGGQVDVTDPKLAEILGKQGIAGAMSAIRRLAKLDVKTIRNGRKAVAYQLVAVTPVATAAVAVDVPEAGTTPGVE